MLTTINKSYKFRIYPTRNQIDIIEEGFRTSAFIYNYFLGIEKESDLILYNSGLRNKDEKNKWKTQNKLWYDKYAASKHLTIISKFEKYSFLQNTTSTLRGYALEDLDNAFKNIKKTGAAFPRFKKFGENNSYTAQIQVKQPLVKKNKKRYTIEIPSSRKKPVGPLDMVCHIPYFADNYHTLKINSVTVSKHTNNDYYLSFQTEEQVDVPIIPEIKEERTIGIDFGVVRPVTTSNDIDFDDILLSTKLKNSKEIQDEIKKIQRIISKKREMNKDWKNSKKYKRLVKKYNKLINHQTNQADNIRHNISSKLVKRNDYDTIVIEDLKIKNMSKKSGNNKSNVKSNFNKALVNTGLNTIKNQLMYKSKWNGKNLVTVDPKYTSQKCSICGHINKLNRTSQTHFKCTNCGTELNADLNAAKNIKHKYFHQ